MKKKKLNFLKIRAIIEHKKSELIGVLYVKRNITNAL